MLTPLPSPPPPPKPPPSPCVSIATALPGRRQCKLLISSGLCCVCHPVINLGLFISLLLYSLLHFSLPLSSPLFHSCLFSVAAWLSPFLALSSLVFCISLAVASSPPATLNLFLTLSLFFLLHSCFFSLLSLLFYYISFFSPALSLSLSLFNSSLVLSLFFG